MLPVVLAAIVFMFIAFASFCIRILFVKNGEFKGTCASNNPFLVKQGATCGVCGRTVGEECGEKDSGRQMA